ncbi:MAG TPA: helix-turn-helix domain-containing protein, partial [Mycobacteriales bacterium]|nr:helix-turn-helix domain-containing protein [Mycobacteriales bacterium]
MTHLLSIGRFAQLTEMTVRALRFYDEVGLFAPEHVDQHSGYRYYGVDQLERAELIARLRRTSLPLDRIREYLDGSDPERVRILDQHRARLHEQADATADAVRLVDRLSAQLAGSTPRPVDATPIVGRTLWDQPVLCIRAQWTEEDVRNYGFVHDIADGVGVVLP